MPPAKRAARTRICAATSFPAVDVGFLGGLRSRRRSTPRADPSRVVSAALDVFAQVRHDEHAQDLVGRLESGPRHLAMIDADRRGARLEVALEDGHVVLAEL